MCITRVLGTPMQLECEYSVVDILIRRAMIVCIVR